MKKALITGITGQDGAYLAEFLLGKSYNVPEYVGYTRYSLSEISISKDMETPSRV